MPTCDVDASMNACAHVRLAELPPRHVCVPDVAVVVRFRRLIERRRPLLLLCLFAVCLFLGPAYTRPWLGASGLEPEALLSRLYDTQNLPLYPSRQCVSTRSTHSNLRTLT